MNSQPLPIIRNSQSLLRHALRGNALFSGLSGLLFSLTAKHIAPVIGLPWEWSLVLIGVLLLAYAVALFYVASGSPMNRRAAKMFSIMDIAWVIGSIVLLVTDWIPFTISGKWAVAIVADVVATFAVLQIWSLRQK